MHVISVHVCMPRRVIVLPVTLCLRKTRPPTDGNNSVKEFELLFSTGSVATYFGYGGLYGVPTDLESPGILLMVGER